MRPPPGGDPVGATWIQVDDPDAAAGRKAGVEDIGRKNASFVER